MIATAEDIVAAFEASRRWYPILGPPPFAEECLEVLAREIVEIKRKLHPGVIVVEDDPPI